MPAAIGALGYGAYDTESVPGGRTVTSAATGTITATSLPVTAGTSYAFEPNTPVIAYAQSGTITSTASNTLTFSPALGGAPTAGQLAIQIAANGTITQSAITGTPTTTSVPVSSSAGFVTTLPVYIGTYSTNVSAVNTTTDTLTVATMSPVATSGWTVLQQFNGTIGTAVTPNKFLKVETDTMSSVPDQIKKTLMGASRYGTSIALLGKFKAGGQITFPLYYAAGMPIHVAALGQDVILAQVSATTTGSVTTTNGQSTIPVTASYQAGAWVKVNAGGGASEELVRVISYAAGSLVTDALVANAAAASGITVTQPVQHFTALSNIPAGYGNQARSLTYESNKGGIWAWNFPATQLGGINYKQGKDVHTVTATLLCSAIPTLKQNAAMAAWNPSAAEKAAFNNAYTILHGRMIVGGDPYGTGTSSVTIAADTEDLEIDIKGGYLELPLLDGLQIYQNFPGLITASAKWKLVQTAGRPAEWQDYLSTGVTTPLMYGMKQNTGTAGSPNWRAFGLYAPAAKLLKANPMQQPNQLLEMDCEAELLPGGTAQDALQLFFIDGTTQPW